MKKTILGFIAGCAITIISTLLIMPTIAASNQKEILASLSDANVVVNGTTVCSIGDIYKNGADTEVPYVIMYENSTYLLLRPLCDAINYNIEWTAASRTVHMYSKQLTKPIDNSTDDDKRDTSLKMDKSLIDNEKSKIDSKNLDEYNEFVSMWDIKPWNSTDKKVSYWAQYNGKLSREEVIKVLKESNKYITYLYYNYANKIDKSVLSKDAILNIAFFHDDQNWNNRLGYMTGIMYENDFDISILIND